MPRADVTNDSIWEMFAGGESPHQFADYTVQDFVDRITEMRDSDPFLINMAWDEGWTREMYAQALYDVVIECMAALNLACGSGYQPSTFAEVKWSIRDVQTLKPGWDAARCRKFFASNGKHIQDSMVVAGWEVMEALLEGEE
jgi:hypothetical protein